MARNIRWQITFKSLNGTTCRVDIYDNDWPADVVMPVRGAADPFYYEEDNSDDLLNGVMRYRTGYIRVVENYYGQLDDIRPESTFDRYVEFLYGGVVVFNGYIQVQDFSNTLEFSTSSDPCPREVEFPVISPLGLFEKRTFPQILPPTTKTLGQLLDMILSGSTYTKVVLPNITNVGFWQTLYSLVVSPWNKDYHHSMTYDAVHKVMKPESYAFLIDAICKAFGWICHDTPTALVFTMFDHMGTYIYYDVGHIGDANYKHNESVGTTAIDLTSYFTLADNNARVYTLLPDTGIEINYEGDLGKVDFTFQRTRFNGVEIYPGWESDPDERFSLCNLRPIDGLWEIWNVGNAEFDSQGGIDYGSAVVAWNGHIGVLTSISDTYPDGKLLFTIRLYTKRRTGETWGVTFDAMASKDDDGNYRAFIGALKDDDNVTAFYVKTEKTVYDDYVEVNFKYHYSDVPDSLYPHLPDYTLIFIQNIKFYFVENNEPYAEYRFTPATKSDYIPSLDAKVSSSITMPISLYRLNSNMIGSSVFSTRLTEYDYLFSKRLVLSGNFRWAASIDLVYARLWTYLNKKWRLISQSFHPWDDEYSLTLQNSFTLDTARHSITATGEHTSLDGYSDSVYDGTSFSHLLTANTGYSITSVTITMGNVDITSTAYNSSTGQITIASVTGDVVITVVAAALPYDSQVEYLQGDGVAYINTGIATTYNTRIRAEVNIMSTAVATVGAFGARKSGSSQQNCMLWYTDKGWIWRYGTASTYQNNAVKGDYTLDNTSAARTMVISGASSATITQSSSSFVPTTDIYYTIFAVNENGSLLSAKGHDLRVKSFKMYNGTTLVRDYIPVRKDGVGYLYDKVSETLFGNVASSGSFSYGNDVTA